MSAMCIDRSAQGADKMISPPIFKLKQPFAHAERAVLAMKYIANCWHAGSKQPVKNRFVPRVRVSQLCL